MVDFNRPCVIAAVARASCETAFDAIVFSQRKAIFVKCSILALPIRMAFTVSCVGSIPNNFPLFGVCKPPLLSHFTLFSLSFFGVLVCTPLACCFPLLFDMCCTVFALILFMCHASSISFYTLYNKDKIMQ